MTGPATEPDPALLTAEIELHGRIMPASNATFLGQVAGTRVVYKPELGERPLWDFPDGTLARRERAAYLVSEAFGWDVVPLTFLRDGPHGPGMVQVWQETDDDRAAVDIVRAGRVPDGWLHVFDGLDDHDHEVSLVHEDTPVLRRMAVFDVVVNNADRKGGHVLRTSDGGLVGVDHGLCFHAEPKLRTVLWGWAGEPLRQAERARLEALLGALERDADVLGTLITADEVDHTMARVAALLADGCFPRPGDTWPAIPWPPF